MSFLFEQALKRACEADPDTGLLYAQWEYDRRLVAESLQSIVRYFPHYSRHEASHSDSILRQIARILGPERVERLSATDLWLVLETAYHHDIGMIVRDDEVRAWLRKDSEFEPYLRDTAQGDDRELAADAKRILEAIRDKSPIAHPPFDVHWALVKLVAEFARRRHAQRSHDVVRQPGRIGLASPRTHLVPARLYDLIGQIAASHGKSLEETLKLPHRESGMGMDLAHPRFIACLLRLGDLLDLDNGRFCPTLLATLGGLPATSKAHVGKHAAIVHLYIAPDRIDVQARCEDYDSYEVTDQWLGSLRGELTAQMARWVEIAPARLGSLPSIGHIGAELVGHVALDPGRRPRFEVDRDAFMHLVQGSNLYSHSFAFVRELIQNAIDATLLRFWKERGSRLPKEKLDTMTPKDLRQALERYPVDIRFERVKKLDNETQVAWSISVTDRGSGISLDDVRHLRTIGGSRRNHAKRRLVESMPEWMRPSGIFGIGLQSVFSVTGEITIKTRHMDEQETHVLTLLNGKEQASDGLKIKKTDEGKGLRRPGTKVKLVALVDRVSRTYSGNLDKTVHRKIFQTYDPIIHDELPLEIANAYDEVSILSEDSLCKLRPVAREFDNHRVTKTATDQGNLEDEGERFSVFDREACLDVSFMARRNHAETNVRYRGSPVTSSLGFRLLDIDCDVLAGEAIQFLALSREKLSESGNKELTKRLSDVIDRSFPEYLKWLRREDSKKEELSIASLRAYAYGRAYASDIIGEEWKEVQVKYVNDINETAKTSDMSLRDLISAHSLRFKYTPHYRQQTSERPDGLYISKSKVDSSYSIEVVGSAEPAWLRRIISKIYPHVTLRMADLDTDQETREPEISFHKSEQAELYDEGSWTWLCSRATANHSHTDHRRKSIPCPKEYELLCHRADSWLPWMENIEGWRRPRMVFPFIVDDEGKVTLNGLSKLVEWTARNAEGGPRPPEDVARAYLQFIEGVDTFMSKDWAARKAYSVDEARREMRHWLKSKVS